LCCKTENRIAVQDGRLPVHYAAANPEAQALYQALLPAAGNNQFSYPVQSPYIWTLNQHPETRKKLFLHCNENSIYVLIFWELRGLGPNFHIHVSVSDLYIPRIVPHISCSRIGRSIVGIYKSLSDI
jgi:hypothetical protein